MKKELLKLRKLLMNQAKECQQRMFAADNKDSWDYGYNHGAKDSAIMLINSIDEIMKKHGK